MAIIAIEGCYTLCIERTKDPINPRSEYYERTGTMLCFHNKHDLGDSHSIIIEDAEALEKELCESSSHVVLPLYLHDHGDLTIQTFPFASNWDSGKVGFIYYKLSPEDEEAYIRSILQEEVIQYNTYLQGNALDLTLYMLDQAIEELTSIYEDEKTILENINAYIDVSSCPNIGQKYFERDVIPDIQILCWERYKDSLTIAS